MRVFYKKQKSTIITYRSYKYFSNKVFIDVQNRISQVTYENNAIEFDIFKTAFSEVIQIHAPIKWRYVRENQAPFINKKIKKEIITRSRVRNEFLNTKSDIDRRAYNKKLNLCVSLIRRVKFLNNFSTRDITDNKTFWRTVKPLFTDKVKTKFKITLIEKRSCFQRRARANSF